jgi:hypothetical protein
MSGVADTPECQNAQHLHKSAPLGSDTGATKDQEHHERHGAAQVKAYTFIEVLIRFKNMAYTIAHTQGYTLCEHIYKVNLLQKIEGSNVTKPNKLNDDEVDGMQYWSYSKYYTGTTETQGHVEMQCLI